MGKAILYGNSISVSGGELTVSAPAGATITATKDGKVKTKTVDENGIAVFKGLKPGTWTITITDGEQTATKNVEITLDYNIAMSFNNIPEFTYTGSYQIVNNFEEQITSTQGNWKIRFLTSGTLTFTSLNGASNGIDVFLVGGGSGGKAWDSYYTGPGGGGGHTDTQKNIQVQTGVSYEIVIGDGGTGGGPGYSNASSAGGPTSAFGISVNGGSAIPGTGTYVGAGGGSGGAGLAKDPPVYGGTDGSDGDTAFGAGGTGQGTTTREFEETSGKLYATGGNNLVRTTGADGIANTGNGGDGGGTGKGGNGGSGIVVIRNSVITGRELNITYPAGSICTLSNGSTTLTAPDTTGIWLCAIPNIGTWTITITNGDKTTSKEIDISSTDRGVSAEITQDLILYKDCTGVVDWSLNARVYNVSYGYSVTLDNIRTTSGEGYANSPIFYPTSKIDLTDYSTLIVKVSETTGSGDIKMGVMASSPPTGVDDAINFVASGSIVEASTDRTVSVDISKLTGEYYVIITAMAYWANSFTAKVSDVYLT